MRQNYFLGWVAAFLLATCTAAFGQQAVQIGGYSFVPEQNAQAWAQGTARGARLELGLSTEGYYNALIQLRQQPNPQELERLQRNGIVLGDYLGGNAYWALVAKGTEPYAMARGTSLVSVVPVRPEWKLTAALQQGAIPSYAREGSLVKTVVRFAENAPRTLIEQALNKAGAKDAKVAELFHAAYASIPVDSVRQVAKLPWVLSIGLQPQSPKLLNHQGRILGRASVLNAPAELGGRGLLGKGVHVGIWDASVSPHVDFGKRVHVQEYELWHDHGTHVTGSVLGSGYLDPNARGMAPLAQAWTYNFNEQRNGLSAQQEMAIARETYDITLTQNSYGIYLRENCEEIESFGYRESDLNLDLLTTKYPTLTHIFAAGNDQEACQADIERLYGKRGYGTSTNRAKNIIQVGAVDAQGKMTSFSCWGPQDDGRMFPTVCAKGKDVWSTVSGNKYQRMSGTSMACPTVTGHAALVSERYGQLYGGAEIPSSLLRGVLANTATDAGRLGPDFQYGYGIMNAERAVVTLENGWHHEGGITVGNTYSQTIAIPAGCKGLRVMLTWNDPAVAKAYKYRDKVMVNDLDLSLEVGGQMFLPWVCNHTMGHLEDPAIRMRDTLNNIEQVTLNADELVGLKEFTVHVNARAVDKGEQPYSLVWYFDTDQPRVIAPADGMLCVPGGRMYVVPENVASPYTIELSYDEGASWQHIARLNDKSSALPLGIPTDAPLTDKALVRVIDAEGHIAKSQHPFTIAPQPTKVTLERSGCGTAGWLLKWDGNAAATQGYEVLLMNPDADNPEFQSLGQTAAGETQFAVPAQRLVGIERPILTVAAKLPGGTLGKRAVGVVANYSVPVKLSLAELPFEETFVKYPSRYFGIEAGANMYSYYDKRTIGSNMPLGSNFLGLVCTKKLEGFDASNYFNKDKNAPNMGTVRMCELDLTDIPATEEILLHISGGLNTPSSLDRTTARMRVLAGENGDELLTSLLGTTVNMATGFGQEWCYALKPGQKHQIVIEFVGQSTDDGFAITRVAIERPTKTRAIKLTSLATPTDGANLGVGKFKVLLENLGTDELKDVLFKIYRSGEWRESYTVPSLKGMENVTLNIPVDLSTQEPFGELIPIRLECVVDPFNPSANGTVEHTVNSMGAIVPMRSTTFIYSPLGKIPIEPRVTHKISGRALFTDNGGVLRPYGQGEESLLKFVPANPNMRVRVRFSKFSTVAGDGKLAIYTEQVPPSLSLTGLRTRAVLSGKLNGLDVQPYTYISEAADGGLTFYFHSGEGEVADGWMAEVDLVPMENPLALLQVSATMQGAENAVDMPIVVRILNRWSTVQRDVKVRVIGEAGELFNEMVCLEPGENDIELTQRLKVRKADPIYLKVAIEGNDSQAADNVQEVFAIYDRYCIPTDLPSMASFEEIYLKSLGSYEQKVELDRWKTRGMRYRLESPVKLYTAEGKANLQIEFGGSEIPVNWGVALWVDWNDNGLFDPEERQEAPLVRGGLNNPTFVYPLGEYSTGVKRVRIMVGPVAELGNPCLPPSKGDVQDCSVALLPGIYPGRNDLALSKVAIGESGNNLSAKQPIKLLLTNRSDTEYVGSVKILATVDGKPLAVEEVTITAGELKPFDGQKEIVLKQTADFSELGKHTVQVELLDNPVPENNSLADSVYCATTAPDGPYWLNTQSLLKGDEWVEVGGVPSLLAGIYRWTTELMFLLDSPQFATLIETEGFQVYTTYRMVDEIPDNAIAVVVGQQLAWTPAGSITPGVWHHLTVSVEAADDGGSLVRVSIDGKNCELTKKGSSSAPYFGERGKEWMRLGSKLNGGIKLFRAHRTVLESGSIKPFQYIRDAEGNLPDMCVAEFAFDNGPKNDRCYSEADMEAGVHTKTVARLENGDGGIWKRLNQLVAGFKCPSLVKTEIADDGGYLLTFAQGTNLALVAGSIIPTIPSVRFYKDGSEISTGASFDFTRPIAIEARADLFGRQGIVQVVNLTAKLEEPSSKELLALKLDPSLNPGLLGEVVADPIAQTCVLQVTAGTIDDPGRVKLSFSVSPGAKLLLKGSELKSDVSEVNLTTPVALEVRAANGESQFYEVRLALSQSIVWNLSELNYIYGDDPVDAKLSTSSALPISVTSTAPNVATLANGTLRIGKPGTTTLTALQAGGNCWDSALPVSKTITVSRRATSVAVRNTKYNAGYPLHLALDYSQLVNLPDTLQMPDPFALGRFTVEDKDGQVVQPNDALPVGKYTVQAIGSTPYNTDCYAVTPSDGEFEVVQADHWCVEIHVTDGTLPLAGVTALMDGKPAKSDSDGVVLYYLKEGAKYTFKLSKPGYSSAELPVDLTKGEDKSLSITLQLATLELKYTIATAGQGVILGSSTQHLAPGSAGTPVMASPADGFLFDQWSDGRKDNPRVDSNLTASSEFKALFSARTYSLTYRIGKGGKLVSGDLQQQLAYDADGSRVEVAPEEGYWFIGWSDGRTSAIRTDRKVKGDISVTARFGKYYQLPGMCNFEQQALTEGWYTESKGTVHNPWTVTNAGQAGCAPLTGYFAACKSDGLDPELHTISYLYSPRYILGDNWEGALIVSMNYAAKMFQQVDRFELQVRVGEGAWKILQKFDVSAYPALARVVVKSQELAGKPFVQFRWLYDAPTSSFAVEVDNIAIAKRTPGELTLHYAAEPAAGGSFAKVNADGSQQLGVEEQQIEQGHAPVDIVAIPAAGYEFVCWSNGDTTPQLHIESSVFAECTYTAYFRDATLAQLSYRVLPVDAGTVTIEGSEGSEQTVVKGGDAKLVTAIPAAGYRFVRWDPYGITALAWRQSQVRESMMITAVFEPIEAVDAQFTVLDEAANPLQNATIQVEDKSLSTNAMGKATTRLTVGSRPFRAHLEGYTPSSGYINVTSFTPASATITLLKGYTVTFAVSDEYDAPVEGVTVEVWSNDYNESGLTGANGNALFLTHTGSYSYRVSKGGYASKLGTFYMDAQARGQRVILARITQLVTFTVTDGKNPIAKAQIVLLNGKNDTIVTDVHGKAMCRLADGEYNYVVKASSYTDERGQIKVAGQPIEKSVVLKAIGTNGIPHTQQLANVEAMPNPFNSELTLKGLTYAHQIQVLTVNGVSVHLHVLARPQEQITLTLGHLPNGVYLVVVQGEGEMRVLRVLKQ